MKKIIKSYRMLYLQSARWSINNLPGILLFNLVIIVLVLLRSAGYFQPFFLLSINSIFFIGFILLPIMLKASREALFSIAGFFWLLSALLQLFRVDIWAERSSIYCFQAFFVGSLILFFEYIFLRKKNV